jgi:hypothetical protein
MKCLFLCLEESRTSDLREFSKFWDSQKIVQFFSLLHSPRPPTLFLVLGLVRCGGVRIPTDQDRWRVFSPFPITKKIICFIKHIHNSCLSGHGSPVPWCYLWVVRCNDHEVLVPVRLLNMSGLIWVWLSLGCEWDLSWTRIDVHTSPWSVTPTCPL